MKYKESIIRKIQKLFGGLFHNNPTRRNNILPSQSEQIRISRIPPKKTFETTILSRQLLVSDSKWYLPTLQEIWVDQIYNFQSTSLSPRIIDCGANIGLSVLFWKHLYPMSQIIAFEPDPETFNLLETNINQFDYRHINLINAAVWCTESVMNFQNDHSVGGALVFSNHNARCIPVQTVRLRDYLYQHVDMLKIDIEGAEYEVLVDCKEQLKNVEYLFVEYHSPKKDKQRLHEILLMMADAGFRYSLKEANPIKRPFLKIERNGFFEMQLNIFGFRN